MHDIGIPVLSCEFLGGKQFVTCAGYHVQTVFYYICLTNARNLVQCVPKASASSFVVESFFNQKQSELWHHPLVL